MKSSVKCKKKIQGGFAGISKMPKRLYSMVQEDKGCNHEGMIMVFFLNIVVWMGKI